jgi:8-oxo-dGTP pyrophosphatase MutT (NUDIX family)
MKFNIRVYGILITVEKTVLVTDELIRGMKITKFPGGGLEYGEGTRDCLQREFMEEMGLAIEVMEHIYTTDYFQPSTFHNDQQIISIYYYVKALGPIMTRLSKVPFDFDEEQLKAYEIEGETESFRMINWADLTEEDLTLPVDKKLVKMLKGNPG